MYMVFNSLILVFTLLFSISAVSHAESRVALVIGNSTYQEQALSYPANDASAIANVLSSLDFQVTLLIDSKRKALRRAIRTLAKSLQNKKGIGLLFYSGHALQFQQQNYLVPIGADIGSSFEVPDEAIDLNYIIRLMTEANNDLNIILLDCCTEQGYTSRLKEIKPGLANVDVPNNMLLSFANSPGEQSGSASLDSSPYNRALIQYIGEPNIEIEQVFKHIRLAVEKTTNNRQQAWYSATLNKRFVLRKAAAREQATDTVEAISDWELVKHSDNIPELEAYIKKYPNSIFKLAAEQRIKNLSHGNHH